MSFEIEINLTPEFYKKVSSEAFKKCLKGAVKETALEIEKICKKECPVDTGNLMRSHSTKLTDDGADIVNSSGYATYVAFGTSKQSPNNYPARACMEVGQKQFFSKNMKEKLKQEGILD